MPRYGHTSVAADSSSSVRSVSAVGALAGGPACIGSVPFEERVCSTRLSPYLTSTPTPPAVVMSTAAKPVPPVLLDSIEHDTDRCVFSLPATRPAAAALPAASQPTAVLEYERLPNGDLDLYVVPHRCRRHGALPIGGCWAGGISRALFRLSWCLVVLCRKQFLTLPGSALSVRLSNWPMGRQHTFVPPDMRGTGAAAQLCHAAFAHARSSHVCVIPSCSYISQSYLRRFPQQADVVRRAS